MIFISRGPSTGFRPGLSLASPVKNFLGGGFHSGVSPEPCHSPLLPMDGKQPSGYAGGRTDLCRMDCRPIPWMHGPLRSHMANLERQPRAPRNCERFRGV